MASNHSDLTLLSLFHSGHDPIGDCTIKYCEECDAWPEGCGSSEEAGSDGEAGSFGSDEDDESDGIGEDAYE